MTVNCGHTIALQLSELKLTDRVQLMSFHIEYCGQLIKNLNILLCTTLIYTKAVKNAGFHLVDYLGIRL